MDRKVLLPACCSEAGRGPGWGWGWGSGQRLQVGTLVGKDRCVFRCGGRVAVADQPHSSWTHTHTHTHTHVLVLIEDSKAPLGLSVVPEGHFPGSLKIKWE